MKTNFHLLVLFFFLLFEYMLPMQINKGNQNLNLNLDEKLSELYNFYKNAIDTNVKDEFIQKKITSDDFQNKIKFTNSSNLTKLETQDYSFIQNSIKKSVNEVPESSFLFQPYVWTRLSGSSEKPTERRGHSVVVADTFMIIFGGCYMDSKCYNELYFFNLISYKWQQIPATGKIPSPRQGHSAVLHGSIMWVYGGSSSDGYLSDLYSFNLETREWKQHYFSNSKKVGLSGHGAIIDDRGKIVVFGGYSEKGYLNEIMLINTVKERFEYPSSTGIKPSPREAFSMELINSRIYLFGGFQEGGVLNDSFSIDLLTWTWIKLETQGPLPSPRQGMASARVGEKIYIVGGCDFRQQKCYNDTFILDTDSLWWSKISNTKSDLNGRGGFTLSFFRGHLFAFAGCELYKQCFKDIFIMNINDICPNKCSGNGECKDKIGCICKSTFVSHDCSRRIKCKADCSNNGICHNNGNCACFPGWSGTVCSTPIHCPKNCTDINNGVCQLNGECKCKPGFTGYDCSGYTIIGNEEHLPTKYNELITSESQRINTNLITIDSNEENASTHIKCPKECSLHGKCNNYTGICHCYTGYYGSDCSIKDKKLETSFAKIRDAPKEEEEEEEDDTQEDDKKNTTISQPNTKSQNTEKKSNVFTIGPNNDVYIKTSNCMNNCMQKGVCLNSTCFCQQGYTTLDCSQTYKDYLEHGFKLADMIKFFIISFVLTGIITLIVLLVKRNHKISGDHIELDS